MSEPVLQPTARPTRKWFAGVATGLATTGVLWIARRAGLTLTSEQGEGIVLGAVAVAGYLRKNVAHDEPGRHAAD